MKRLHETDSTNAQPGNANEHSQNGRCLTDEEWRYLQHRLGMIWREGVGMCVFMLSGFAGLGILAWRFAPEKEMYFLGFFSLIFLIGLIVFAVIELPRMRRVKLDHERLVKERQIRIFPLPLIWFQPNKGCEVRSEKAEVLPHWSRFFKHLRPINGDGSLDIEAEIYETSEENYVIALSNGLSVGKELPVGMLDTLAMCHARRFTWAFFVFFAAIFAGFMLNAALGIFPVAESFGAFLTEAKWLIAGAVAFLSALGVPAIYFWRQHKQALARIEAMYEAEGLPERGHAKNVGSAIDNASNATPSHDRNSPDTDTHDR